MRKLGVLFCLFLVGCQSTPTAETNGVFTKDIAHALKQAKSGRKFLLISFNAIWCPPCNQLEEMVYESSGFFDRSKDFVALQVDADAPSSWILKDKYAVSGYPTVLFANSEGNEIYRIIGYRSPSEFFNIMEMVKKSKGEDLSKSCNKNDPDSLWMCASVCRERKDHQCARRAFLKLEKELKEGTYRYEEARTYFAETAETDELKRLNYEKLMKKYPESPMALLWALKYISFVAENSKLKINETLIRKVLSQVPTMENDPRREAAGLTKSDMLQIQAMLETQIGERAAARKTWSLAANLLEQLSREYPKGHAARAFTLERIYCLKSAERPGEALKLAENYQSKFPDEFTFHFIAASLLNDQKKYSQALPITRKAYELSYGDNKIRVATLLIELLGILKDSESIEKVYAEVSKTVTPDQKLQVRTHRYLKQMREAYDKARSHS